MSGINTLRKYYLLIALGLYYLLTLLTFSVWEVRGQYRLTGDEPHYLIMSQGLLHRQLEQSAAYRQEFHDKTIYPPGLAPADAIPSPDNTHAVQGPNGLFNVHNLGLPILLAIPFLLGGIIGAKLFMISLCGLAVVTVWKLSGMFAHQDKHRLLATMAATLVLPLLAAASQLYPDLLAGIIALGGLYWLLSAEKQRSAGKEAFLMLGLVFLPWLQIKFGPTAAILILGVLHRVWQRQQYQRLLGLMLITLSSLILLIIYNQYAFGNPFGPYSLPPYNTYSIEISRTSLMVFLGLHLDQNQGLFLQNPLLFVGLLSLRLLFGRYRRFLWWWLAVYLSLLIPNALHPVWYGGTSFSGRFEWASALVFTIPTLYGLLQLAQRRPRIFYILLAASLLSQASFYGAYTFMGLDLYRKTQAWLFTYPIFYPGIYNFVPFFGDAANFWKSGINYSWMGITVALLIAGFTKQYNLLVISSQRMILSIAMMMLLLLAVRYFTPEVQHTIEFRALYLPSATGRLVDGSRLAQAGIDPPGHVTFGPYIELPQGSYTATFHYHSIAPVTANIGNLDIYSNPLAFTVTNAPLKGSAGHAATTQLAFSISAAHSGYPYEFRSFWNGSGSLAVDKIVLIKIN